MGSFLPKKGRFFKTLRRSYAALRAAGATASPCDAWGYAPLPRRWGNGAAMRRLGLNCSDAQMLKCSDAQMLPKRSPVDFWRGRVLSSAPLHANSAVLTTE